MEVEVLAAVLDQLSDMLDRVAAESYLETARRPESVRRLLALIGFDAATAAGLTDEDPGTPNAQSKELQLERLWSQNPALMEAAKREGPLSIHTQRRMVTLEDYAARLVDHPLVLRATAWEEWSGSWTTLRVATVLWQEHHLDEQDIVFPADLKGSFAAFHHLNLLPEPVWEPDPPTIRTILRPYLDALRMIGQEVFLQDAVPVGINTFIPTEHIREAMQDPHAAKADRDNYTQGWFVETMPDLNQRNPFMATYLIQNTLGGSSTRGCRACASTPMATRTRHSSRNGRVA